MKSEKKRGVPRRKTSERIIDGLGVSLGIAIGPAHVMEAGSVDIPEYTVDENKIPAELERFKDAVEKSQRQLRKLKTKSADLPGAAAEELGFCAVAMLTAPVAALRASPKLMPTPKPSGRDHRSGQQLRPARGRLSRGARRRYPRSRRPPDPQPDQEPLPGVLEAA
jgi:hypothetical protein